MKLTIFAISVSLLLIFISVMQTEEKQAIKQATESTKQASGTVLIPELDVDAGNEEKSLKRGKMTATEAYIDRFAELAVDEMHKFGIPASITLSQGILESASGQSQMAIKDNNHFGIKCKSKCIGCRCANYADDSKYDMFRIFETAWESYREHSKLLSGSRYAHLKAKCNGDFKCWANGLQKAGYATSKKYAVALIAIIKKFNLQKFDKLKK